MSDATHDATNDATNDRAAPAPVDLDRLGHDLEGVEAALARLDAGTYWTDEITGAPLSDELLATDPVARRATEQGEA